MILARPGRNCGMIARADALGVVVDGAAYFRALKHVLLGARRSILLVGWEFDSRTRLERDEGAAQPDTIGPLLNHLVSTRPGLRAHVLIWDSALIYAVNREFAGLVKMDWLTHRRLCFRLDDSHPIASSHHQKIVVVDDCIAFVGGLDVTSQRWDTRAHVTGDPRRFDPGFPAYPPFHDVMAVVGGEAARALAQIARERWRLACGQVLKPVPPGDARALWPPWLPRLMGPVPVALARTSPAWDGAPAVREVEQLYLDMIAAARRFIYMENQYFASRRIAQALAERLGEPECPEIVVINPGEPASLMERSTMGVARSRLMAELARLDDRGRLRVYTPAVDGNDVKVHSKLMIVDDRLLRVGSSNLNNRSLGLDTECDLLAEATGPDQQLAIRALRHDLLAEHLGSDVAEVAAAELAAGGLHGAIALLAGNHHTLVPLDWDQRGEVVRLLAETGIPDPEEPVETLLWVEEAMPGPAKRPLQVRVWALALLLVGLCLAALAWAEWGWAGHPWVRFLAGLRHDSNTPPVVLAAFLAGGVMRVPVSLLVLGTAMALGPWPGVLHALAGALASAVATYGLGAALGKARVRRLAGWKINRVHRVLARHGILAILLLRMMPVAAFSVVNLVAGAAAVSLRDFVLGTLVGMAPGIIAISVVGDRLLAVLRNPTPANMGVLVAATILAVAAQFAVVRRLGKARANGGPKGGLAH